MRRRLLELERSRTCAGGQGEDALFDVDGIDCLVFGKGQKEIGVSDPCWEEGVWEKGTQKNAVSRDHLAPASLCDTLLVEVFVLGLCNLGVVSVKQLKQSLELVLFCLVQLTLILSVFLTDDSHFSFSSSLHLIAVCAVSFSFLSQK